MAHIGPLVIFYNYDEAISKVFFPCQKLASLIFDHFQHYNKNRFITQTKKFSDLGTKENDS